MNTKQLITTVKSITIAASTAIALFSVSHCAKADELSQLAEAGYISYLDEEGTQRSQKANDSDVIQSSQGDLLNVTLTQTFINDSSEVLVAQYIMPMPNPAALINYTFENSSYAGCSGDDSQVVLAPGEQATITVEFALLESQMVAFHSADFSEQAVASLLDTRNSNSVIAQKE